MKKVLVIEDDEVLRSIMIEALGFEDYEMIGAANGREGVLSAQKHLPHLIICDINMPVLNGFGVITELRQDSLTCDIPVIFLSADMGQTAVQVGLQLGAVSFLVKPCPLDKLLAAIRSQIGD